MPLEIRCASCGFVLYRGRKVKSVYDVLRSWGFRCPCCFSKLELKIVNYRIEPVQKEQEQEGSKK